LIIFQDARRSAATLTTAGVAAENIQKVGTKELVHETVDDKIDGAVENDKQVEYTGQLEVNIVKESRSHHMTVSTEMFCMTQV